MKLSTKRTQYRESVTQALVAREIVRAQPAVRRAGRPGRHRGQVHGSANAGRARHFASMKDDVLRRFLPETLRQQVGKMLGGNHKESRAASERGAGRYTQLAAQGLAAWQLAGMLRNDT
jgi:preprotein translocase subunit SecA